MSEIKDTVFFRLLEGRKTENAKIYVGILLQTSTEIARVLELIKKTFPEYPDHGIQHACRILTHAAKVLDKQLRTLSDTELFCFILAALFHDTGMSLVGFSAKDALRREHPQNAARVIDGYFEEALSHLRGKDRIKAVVKYVCKAHGMDIHEMYGDPEFSQVDTINGDDVRNSVLSVFLRIGDLLDLDEERTSWLALKLFPELFPEEAKNHNIRHLHVTKYYYGPARLSIEVQAENVAQYKIWHRWFQYLGDDILYANTYLKEEKIYFPVLNWEIKKTDNAKFDVEEIRFELDDKGGIWDIISQSIYTNEFDFIREVVQNAIDATLFDVYQDEKYPLAHPSPRSWALSPEGAEVCVCYSAEKQLLYVIDKGIGMDVSDLRRFLFKVSSTGYRETNQRKFPFPAIAKYGIGFVSCMVNAEKIEIYTAKESDTQMQKVTLETGVNQAFIEKMPQDGYVGTTLVLKLKHSYEYEKIRQYLWDTFRYPSVEILCIDGDKLAENGEKLCARNVFREIADKPYALPGIARELRERRNVITDPVITANKLWKETEKDADELINWIQMNLQYTRKSLRVEKLAEFKAMAGALERRLPDGQTKKCFPFTGVTITKEDLLSNYGEYLDKLSVFLESIHTESEKAYQVLQEYPLFYTELAKNLLSFSGDWKYLVARFDNDLQICGVEKYKKPIDLSRHTGLILMRHSYENYDDGIEYAAINGFLVYKGEITNRLMQFKGYHEVLHSERREKRFVLGSYDQYGSVGDCLQAEYLEDTEEAYLIENDSGEYGMGMAFESVGNTVSIVNNGLVSERGIDLEHEGDIEKWKPYNAARPVLPPEHGESLELGEDFLQIDSLGSLYCQDGIAIPFEIEQLFPVGYIRLLCNTTHTARLPLNVTRHETSRIRSDLDAWYEKVGSKIQQKIYENVCEMLSDVNLELKISTSSELIWERNLRELFGVESIHRLYKLGKSK